MPIPDPMSNESRDAFMSRCMDSIGSEPNAAAICEAHFTKMMAAESTQNTKRVDGEDLPMSAFAYHSDPNNLATWKLPIEFSTAEKSAAHIRNALARWDQTDMPDAAEKSKARSRLVAAAKKHGIDVSAKAEPGRIVSKAKHPSIVAMSAPVEMVAAKADSEAPPRFNVTAYTGQPMRLSGWDKPVVVEISGMQFADSLLANLDHETTKRVGHVDQSSKVGGKVLLSGVISAVNDSSHEVVASGKNAYPWQASIEADPLKVIDIGKGKTFVANDQQLTGPMYHVTESILNGFGFVTRGADSKTSATIAASAASKKEKVMTPECKTWIESMGLEIEGMSQEQIDKLEANYDGKSLPKTKKKKVLDKLDAMDADAERVEAITEYAATLCGKRRYERDYIESVKKLAEDAIEAGWTVDKFRLEALESSLPLSYAPMGSRRESRLNDRILEAAIAQCGRLSTIEEDYTDQELQAAHDRFKHGIGLKQLFVIAAQARGYRTETFDVTLDVQRAAFGMVGPQIQADGFSTINIANVISNVANKFLMEAWNTVDLTPMRIAAIRSVRDFKQATTVSLTGALQFEALGPGGEIKHGTIADLTYTSQAATYAAMLAIRREDIINDDLGALTSAPRRLGRGGALKLNDVFWTAFLLGVSTNFFAAGNSNINTGVADMTLGGLAATETIFMNQTDPDGKPLGLMPRILLVPTALKAAALTLMNSELVIAGTATAAQGSGNIWRGRFTVESSPYISNSSYTGNTAVGWWMLANPNELPVVEIAALNGRVEPVVDTADAEFNMLGVQMRGYSDIGVALMEKRAGVYADGGSS